MEIPKAIEVIIIGAGPAGLSVAAEAAYHGLGETWILEKGENHNQTIRQYYPEAKRVDASYMGQEAICAGVLCFRDTTKSNFLHIADQMAAMYHSKIVYGENVDSIKRPENGKFLVSGSQAVYEASQVVIGIGRMGKPNRPDYFASIPPSARTRVHFDVRKILPTSQSNLVIGGGNVAVEFALSLSHKTKVALSYRQMTFSRLNPMNLSLLEKEEKAGEVEILRGSNVERIEEQDGKPKVIFKEGGERVFDDVIFGIGGSSPVAFLQNTGMQLDPKGNPVLSPELESSIPGLYVAGELSVPQGKGSIIVSFNSGKTIVESIMNRRGLTRKPEVVDLQPMGL